MTLPSASMVRVLKNCVTPCQSIRFTQKKIVDGCGKSESCSCWSCHEAVNCTKQFFCDSCNLIQPPAPKNLFEYVGLPTTFHVDENTLKKNFRQIQSQVHPDKFAHASEEEKNMSDEHSRMLNEAYKTLTEPLTRAKYLIEILGDKNSNADLDEEELMEMMERNEEIAEMKTDESLEAEMKKIQKEIESELASLGEHFKSKTMEKAKKSITKLSYLYSLRTSVNKMLGY